MSPAICFGMIDAVILINTVSVYLHPYQHHFYRDQHRYQSCALDYQCDYPHDLDHLDHHDHDYRLDFPHPLSHMFRFVIILSSLRLCHALPCHQTSLLSHQGLITAIALSEDDVYAAICVILNMPLGLVDVSGRIFRLPGVVSDFSIFFHVLEVCC